MMPQCLGQDELSLTVCPEEKPIDFASNETESNYAQTEKEAPGIIFEHSSVDLSATRRQTLGQISFGARGVTISHPSAMQLC